ncbi:MAG: hypothetical protein LBG52_00030 [Candidatus Peribacteria bacterium]|jgi:hypothetical protein|nr:hypothetical protein [Candidatus Peribacteria bacterium]
MEEDNKKNLENLKKEVEKMLEVELFLYMEGAGSLAWSERHYYDGTFLSDTQAYWTTFQEIVLSELVRRFRVHPRPTQDVIQLSLFGFPEKHSLENWNYWKWYHFWKDWMNYFDDGSWSIVQSEIAEKDMKNLAYRLPIKNWDDVERFDEESCLLH